MRQKFAVPRPLTKSLLGLRRRDWAAESVQGRIDTEDWTDGKNGEEFEENSWYGEVGR